MLVILKFHERDLGGECLKSLLKGEIMQKKKMFEKEDLWIPW